MKILILGFTKVKFMPYMNFYLENIGRDKNEVHLLYWNRDLQDEDLSSYNDIVFHEFRCYQEDDVSKFYKVGSFLKYRKFAKKLLKSTDYDFIIVLHSLPGVLLYKNLKKNYKNRFIFDYRDSTYEAWKPFKNVVAGLVESSIATFVSSDGFRRFLPESEKNKIFTSHNILSDSLLHRDEKAKYGIESDKIRIAFWGFIRHEEINKEIIKKISADDRFELHYYGREQQVAINLKKYAEEISARNIFFHGEYKPEERYDFVRRTDIIHNIYYDRNTMLAMGNKYYDGPIFYIPQICMKGSFMGASVRKGNIGMECCPLDVDFTQQLYHYYTDLNMDEFKKNCDNELDRVLNEYLNGEKFLKILFRRF